MSNTNDKKLHKSALITGLWKRKTENGETYLIGRVGSNLNAVVVPNKSKEKENEPDYYLFFTNGPQSSIAREIDSISQSKELL